MATIYIKYKKKINISSIEDMQLDKVYLNEYTYSAQIPESIKDEYHWRYLNITLDENETEYNIKNIDFRNLLPNGEYDLQYFVLKDNDALSKVKINKVLLIIDDSNIDLPTTPTPTPLLGFPINVILSNFTGSGGETCGVYNGTYPINEQYIDGEPSSYTYELSPQNEYVVSNSVTVGYDASWDDISICLNLTTADGSYQLCQRYDIDWSTGNYIVAFGGGFPTTPWCIGDIALEFTPGV